MRPFRSSLVGAVAVAVAVGAGWAAGAVDPDTRPPLTSALDALPADTLSAGFTDWSSIADHLDVDLEADGARQRLVDDATSRDLATRSVIADTADPLHGVLGWSPVDVEWEVYGQTPRGEVATVRLHGSVSFDTLRERLGAGGYRRSESVWTIGSSDLRKLGLTDLESAVALVPRRQLVVLSTTPALVRESLDVIGGRERSLASVRYAVGTAQALAGSDSVLLQAGRAGCEGAAVGGDAAQQAAVAEQRAGGLSPYVYSGRAIVERGGSGFAAQRLAFAMTFESAATATDQALVREDLASGPFIGRQGRMRDSLRDASVGVAESTVRLGFDHDPDSDVFMTGFGPLLFAAC